MTKQIGKKSPKFKVKMTEASAIKIFGKYAKYIELNPSEGYYEIGGIKGLDTREVFVDWAKQRFNLDCKGGRKK